MATKRTGSQYSRSLRFGINGPAISLDGDWFADRDAPREDNAILALARSLFPAPGTGGNGLAGFNQCGEVPLTRFLFALRTANIATLGEVQRHIEGAMGEVTLVPGSRPEVYVVRPKQSKGARREDTDPFAGVDAVAIQALEAVRTVIEDPGWDPRIVIVMLEMGRVRGSTAPPGSDGRSVIKINRTLWAQGSPGYRKALLAHELFHHAQYRHGFRSRPLEKPYAWFSEGTASWMEHAATGTVTTKQKAIANSAHPNMGLLNASYYSFPFWLELTTRKASIDMRSVLAACSEAPSIDALGPTGIDVQAACEESLKQRLAGTPLAPSGVRGPDNQVLTAAVRAKKIVLEDCAVRFCGSVPRYGSEVFEIAGSGPRGWVRVDGNVNVDVGQPAGLLDIRVKHGMPTSIELPCRLAVTGRGDNPEATCLFHVSLGPTADPDDVFLDSLGNVRVRTGSSWGVIGYNVDGYSSIGRDNPLDPAEYVSWFTGSVTSFAGCTSARVKLAPHFRARFTKVKRTLDIDRKRGAVTVTTKIYMAPGAGGKPGYEAIVLTRAANNPAADGGLDNDGDEPQRCDGIECDGAVYPMWFNGFHPGNRLSDDPIVPYGGKAFLPPPAGSAGTEFKEVYEIRDEAFRRTPRVRAARAAAASGRR